MERSVQYRRWYRVFAGGRAARPDEYAYAGHQDGEVAEHLDHQHYRAASDFGEMSPEIHR